MNKKLIYFVEIIIFSILIFADQFTKKLAVSKLMGKDSFVIIKKVLCFHYLENRGAAFGMLQNAQIFFALVGVAFLAFAIYALVVFPVESKYSLLRFTIVMIAAGAVGNMIDRVLLKYVVDFIYFEYIDFPVFNVADIYVTVGTALLIILVLFFYKDDELDFKKLRNKSVEKEEKA